MKNIGKLLTIIFTISFVLLTISFFVFRGEIIKLLDTSQNSTLEQTDIEKNSTTIEPQKLYHNPFEDSTQYKNPFETYQNPFDQ